MTALPRQKKYTPDEYLALEEEAVQRSEFVNGNVFAMSGGTEAHTLISFNLTRIFADKLRGKCRAYQSEMKVWVAAAQTYFYPDVTVVCGERVFHRGNTGIVENPLLIAEVLSKTTEAYDKNDKFFAYQNIETFTEYVLVAQDKPVVQQFIRQSDGDWKIKATIGLSSKIYFESVGVEASLKEIYDLIEFTEENL